MSESSPRCQAPRCRRRPMHPVVGLCEDHLFAVALGSLLGATSRWFARGPSAPESIGEDAARRLEEDFRRFFGEGTRSGTGRRAPPPRSRLPDHYRVLGVAAGASAAELKTAHRRAARRHHPDRPGGSTERMAEVNAAWDILGDAEKRAEYDAARAFGG